MPFVIDPTIALIAVVLFHFLLVAVVVFSLVRFIKSRCARNKRG